MMWYHGVCVFCCVRLKYGYQADDNIEFAMLKYTPSFRIQKELFLTSLRLIKRKEFDAFYEYRKNVSDSLIFKLIYPVLTPVIWWFKSKR